MRINGFKRPYHRLQIVSWVYMGFIVACFACIVLPLLPYNIKVLVGMGFTASLVLVVILGYICTYIDPSDPALLEAAKAQVLSYFLYSKALDYKKYPKICKICKKHVNLDTKHCRDCNRCVLHFDHHCKWLNNCIGAKNYKSYSYLLATFQCFNLIIAIIGIWVTAEVLQKNNPIYDNLKNKFNLTELTEGAYISILILMDFLSTLIAIFNGHLVVFHIYLGCRKITTYDYVVEFRKSKNKYKVSEIIPENGREIIEEVPLEDVFEPYMENPQYETVDQKSSLKNIKICPMNFAIVPISDSDSLEHSIN